ncbi:MULTISPECIES: hypothetical protein [unclassified Novosphingobium]|uniref:hypothetical protein n=1 Tax=unclassified Novosphingobium TaxID=2644732 RepID=UPI0025EEB7FD|nr:MULTISPECIES: hypothetical protein [unclassified Novosphingobium]
MPSWRFFDAVSESPRVDYAVLSAPKSVAEHWQEFRPRPAVLKPATTLRRMLWNPQWNENLFLVSLAERLMTVTTAETDAHSERELLLRVARHLDRHEAFDAGSYLQIRLRFVSRSGPDHAVTSQIAYLSGAHLMAGLITR